MYFIKNLTLNLLLFERPSKHYMFERLKKELQKRIVRNSILIDAACQWAWNRRLFPDSIGYYGVDVDYTSLVRAKNNHPNDNFIHLNILDLNRYIPKGSVDCIVSTNTLEHLKSEDHLAALHIFSELLSEGGVLIFSYPSIKRAKPLISSINPNFKKVTTINYRNIFSWIFEAIVSNSHGLYDLRNNFNNSKLSIFLGIFAKTLSSIEAATHFLPYPANNYILVVAEGRLRNGKICFHSNHFQQDENGILTIKWTQQLYE